MAQNMAGVTFFILGLVFELKVVAGYNLGNILVLHPPDAAHVREVVYGLPHLNVPQLPYASSYASPSVGYRSDGKCGCNYPLADGSPSQCQYSHCCSNLGWCGNSNLHCRCPECTNLWAGETFSCTITTTTTATTTTATATATTSDTSVSTTMTTSSTTDTTATTTESESEERPKLTSEDFRHLQEVCGKEPRPSVTRIINGKEADKHRFPWIASVDVATEQPDLPPEAVEGPFWCGGALITNQHVLTAAHCVTLHDGAERDKSSFRITLGGHDLTNADEMNSSASVYAALDLRVHDDYDPVTIDSDIALITLDRKVEFTDKVFPVCLPKSEENLFVGEDATVAGWGVTEAGAGSNILKFTELILMDNKKCQEAWDGGDYLEITKNMICGWHSSGSACNGDSGGPLTCQPGDRHELCGLVSFGYLRCVLRKTPNVFLRTSEFLEWIYDNIYSEESTCVTVGGDDPVSECALPFTRNGVTHNDCTTVDAIDGKPWCSTEVDADGVHADGRGHWGYCGSGCNKTIAATESEWSPEFEAVVSESESVVPQCADSNEELLSAAEAGEAGAVALLLFVLDCPELDVNHRDRFGRTPLFLAAWMGHELVVKALLEHAGTDVNAAKSSDGSTPLSAAASNNNVKVVEIILEADAVDVNKPTEAGETALYMAARKDHSEVVKLLLQHEQVDVNRGTTTNGDTPLVIAAKRGKTESVRTLLYHPDIDVNHRTKIDNTTALNEAAYRGLPDIVSLLIVRPEIDMNQVAYKGDLTPLIHATLGDNIEVVRLLLGHPETDVNQASTDNGGTALHWASYHGQAEIVGLLLSHPDIRVDQENDKGATALNFATEGRAVEALELLLEHPEVDVNHAQNMTEPQFCTGCTSLMTAALQGFPAVAKILLQQSDVDVNILGIDYQATALGMAAFLGNKEVVRLLLLFPDTDWNVKDTFGSTAYCDAVHLGHTDIQEMFQELAKETGKLLDDECVIEGNEEEWRQRLSSKVGVGEKYLL